jgi:hypothetical protein
VRQNIAEIDEIPAVEHIRMLTLPPAERAIYLELAHHLQAMEMNHKKYKKGARACGDREARMAAILGESQSAEEARAHAAAATLSHCCATDRAVCSCAARLWRTVLRAVAISAAMLAALQSLARVCAHTSTRACGVRAAADKSRAAQAVHPLHGMAGSAQACCSLRVWIRRRCRWLLRQRCVQRDRHAATGACRAGVLPACGYSEY